MMIELSLDDCITFTVHGAEVHDVFLRINEIEFQMPIRYDCCFYAHAFVFIVTSFACFEKQKHDQGNCVHSEGW